MPLKLEKNLSGLNRLKLILLQEVIPTKSNGQRDIVQVFLKQIMVKELLLTVTHGLEKLIRELSISISEQMLLPLANGIVLHVHLLMMEE